MDLISLLITIFGIMILLGLYVMSRLFSQDPSKQNNKDITIPVHTDRSGNRLSSIKADIPARDQPTTTSMSMAEPGQPIQQFVLFIASKTATPLNGNLVLNAFQELHLTYGDNQLYHYLTENKDKLFSIANGIAPWTLSEENLRDKNTPGLSIIMPLPTPIESNNGINIMVDTSSLLADKINGELQNDRQQIFLETDRQSMLVSIA
ncbi:MAG: hypothetical protein KAH22_11060 [Thiotrichaceae bacterium]|nr:hypothetical protein [Thiotrichaceae bacterium]